MFVRGIASKQSVDLQGHLILAGAFDASIARRRLHNIALLLSHDSKRRAGHIFKLSTRNQGLHICAIVDPNLPGVSEYLADFKKGETLGFSIGARDVRGIEAGPHKLITQADLYEVSLTKHPVNPECLVTFVERDEPLWPIEFRQMFAEQDAAVAACPNPRTFIPTIRYEDA